MPQAQTHTCGVDQLRRARAFNNALERSARVRCLCRLTCAPASPPPLTRDSLPLKDMVRACSLLPGCRWKRGWRVAGVLAPRCPAPRPPLMYTGVGATEAISGAHAKLGPSPAPGHSHGSRSCPPQLSSRQRHEKAPMHLQTPPYWPQTLQKLCDSLWRVQCAALGPAGRSASERLCQRIKTQQEILQVTLACVLFSL